MSLKFISRLVVLALLAALALASRADDRLDYNAQAATALMELYRSLDRNADGLLTRDESKGDLNMEPLFDDLDTNRDGLVTQAELQTYVERRFGRARVP